MIDPQLVDQFTSSCAALGVEALGRKSPANLDIAKRGFEVLTARHPEQCDAWRGRAAAARSAVPHEVLEHAYKTIDTCGELIAASDVAATAVDFAYFTGMYVNLVASGSQGIKLALAAARVREGQFQAARELLDDRLLSNERLAAGWGLAVIYFRAQRWHDVRQVLGPLSTLQHGDAMMHQAVGVAYGIATANLGMAEQALGLLEPHVRGPIPAANADALLTAALCARELGRSEMATSLLNEAYTVVPAGDDDARGRITEAISDPTFGIIATTATRIDARTDYWDPATEPGEREHSRQLGSERREALKAEAAAELDALIGMAEVKEEIARLESGVRVSKRREELGLPVRNKSLHLVLKGPPGVGKTTVARVIAKLLCAAEVLPSDHVVEVGRADLVDKHIGGSEEKVKQTIGRIVDAGGGVLFIDEAYALTDTDSERDYGKLVITQLMTAMIDYADIMMVIAAGYPDKMAAFLESNEGLASRFGRELVLPSYSVEELVQISEAMAAKTGSKFADLEPLRAVYGQLHDAKLPDQSGDLRAALDVAGNGRCAEFLVQFAEEEREFRLDRDGLLDTATVEDFQTITGEDARRAGVRMLRKVAPDGSLSGRAARGERGRV